MPSFSRMKVLISYLSRFYHKFFCKRSSLKKTSPANYKLRVYPQYAIEAGNHVCIKACYIVEMHQTIKSIIKCIFKGFYIILILFLSSLQIFFQNVFFNMLLCLFMSMSLSLICCFDFWIICRCLFLSVLTDSFVYVNSAAAFHVSNGHRQCV
jgi:hypothetical protein